MNGSLRSWTLPAACFVVGLLLGVDPCPAEECAGTGELAATLLVPYFDVDLEVPSGATAMFSIANADARATVARVVLWTNLGHPTLAFDVLVAAGGVVTVNLRDVFAGRLPVTGAGAVEVPDGCTAPLTLPKLPKAKRLDLHRRHTGRPAADGLCYGEPEEDGIATGFVTVDVMDGCLPAGRVPGDGGPYFAGEGGLAAERNVLWGDFFLLDPQGGLAAGFRSVPIPADAAIEDGRTFYSVRGTAGADRRRRLPHAHRTRFLAGGELGTELIVWSGFQFDRQFFPPPGDRCETFAREAGLRITASSEGADALSFSNLITARQSLRVPVVDGPISLPGAFGLLELRSYLNCSNCGQPDQGPLQSWIGTLMEAEGSFSVGFEAAAGPACP